MTDCRHSPAGRPVWGLGGPDPGNRREFAVATCATCGQPIYRFVTSIPGARRTRESGWQAGTPRNFERY